MESEAQAIKSTSAPRVVWADTAQGIVILLVVAGHSFTNPLVNRVIYSFHMPFFFLMSGYFFSDKKGFASLLYSRSQSLLLPYVVTRLIVAVAGRFITHYLGVKLTAVGMVAVLLSLVYSFATVNPLFPTVNTIGNLWFLPCLFVSNLLFFSFIKITGHWHLIWQLLALGALFTLGEWMGSWYLTFWCVDVALAVQFFLWFGYQARKTNFFSRPFSMPYAVIALTVWGLDLAISPKIELHAGEYGYAYLSFPGAFCATYLVILFSHYVTRFHRITVTLSYLGRIALVILCYHSVLPLICRAPASLSSHFPLITECFYFTISLAGCVIAAKILVKIPILGSVYFPRKNKFL